MEDESRRWFSSMSERRWLSSRKNLRYSLRQIISVAVVVDSRWLPSTNLGGYPRRITVAIVDGENLWLSPTIRSGGGLISSLKKSKDTAPPNSPISLYSPSSSFSSLATPGIWSKRSVKSKLVRKTFVVSKGIKKEPKQVSGEILSFFTWKNFNVYSSWRNNYERTVPRRGQAALLTFCTCKGDMDYKPFSSGSNFVDLLQSQQESVFSASQLPFSVTHRSEDCNFGEETPLERRERRKCTPSDDIVLISSWLNTSKDHVVANEQRSEREPMHCKQRWQKINDLVCKFCGSYEAATRKKTSGQNETDVLKRAHEIFYNNYKKKFTLEHAWIELRNEQKWCDLSSSKQDGSSKKRKLDDGAQSSTSHATESKTSEADEGTNRPLGVKASKGRGKKTTFEGTGLSEFQTMWSIKQQDLVMKERLSKMSLLDSLIEKKEPLSEAEEALKKKLINDLLFV
uniref:No apical meristem-associated C-terminal domain-containing protein n=2 Tax=Brassica oleracea TaxID=3712 RepID=A0A0D3A6J2_BRAOL|nr:unnamed protein product [Brassica oleracea]